MTTKSLANAKELLKPDHSYVMPTEDDAELSLNSNFDSQVLRMLPGGFTKLTLLFVDVN